MGKTCMRMRRNKHRKLMMDPHRMSSPEGVIGLTWEPVMSTYMIARMVTLRIRMCRKMHRKQMMNQRRMWRTEGIVLESVKIRQYISDLENTIMAKEMQWQAMNLKRRLYWHT